MTRRALGVLVLCAACTTTTPTKPATVIATVPAPETTADRATIGAKPPGFSLDSVMPGGSKVTIATGKVTIVAFWATWNGPCKQSFPKLEALYRAHKAQGLEIAALSIDDEAMGCVEWNGWGTKCIKTGNGLAQAAQQWGATFAVAWDEGHKVAEKWKPDSVPTIYVIDRTGVIRYLHRGWHDGEEQDLEREIKELL